MAISTQQYRGTQPYRGGSGYVARSSSSGLYDVLELILDKGLVIDVFVRVSLIGIEILTIDARIVIASVDTYLRFAAAANRLDIGSSEGAEGLPDLMESVTSGGAASKTKGVLEGVKEKITGGDEDSGDKDSGDKEKEPARRSSRSSSRSSSGSRSSGGNRSSKS